MRAHSHQVPLLPVDHSGRRPCRDLTSHRKDEDRHLAGRARRRCVATAGAAPFRPFRPRLSLRLLSSPSAPCLRLAPRTRAAAAVASAQYNFFTPVLQGFSGGGCNNGTQVWTFTLSECARRTLCARVANPLPHPPLNTPYPRCLRAPALASADGCTALGTTGKYAKGSCTYEDDKTATLSVCTDPACSSCSNSTSVVESEKCYISGGASLPIASETNVRMHCASEQTASAASVVVGLAVTLSLSAAAMCAFWVYKDKRAHKAEAAAGYSSV